MPISLWEESERRASAQTIPLIPPAAPSHMSMSIKPDSMHVLTALAAVLLTMLLFIVARRVWRGLRFRRLDRLQQHWLQRLPALLAGGTPDFNALHNRRSREVLESLIINRLQTPDPYIRRQSLALLDWSGLMDIRVQLLRSGSRGERLQSAAILGQIGSPAVVPPLIAALLDSAPLVSAAAMRSLGMIGDPAAGRALVRYLKHGGSNDQAVWLEAVSECVPTHANSCRSSKITGTTFAYLARKRSANPDARFQSISSSPMFSTPTRRCGRGLCVRSARPAISPRCVC
jgi:hypothetical protein